jgi:hypothetical protein
MQREGNGWGSVKKISERDVNPLAILWFFSALG